MEDEGARPPGVALGVRVVALGFVGNARTGHGFQLDEGDLSPVTAVVQAGHVLRLTLELGATGNATQVVLGYDATTTPSRLDLTAAPPPGAAAP